MTSNPADTPAGMATTDLMARLALAAAEAVAQELGYIADGEFADAGEAARDALLRTLAAMPDDEVVQAAITASEHAVEGLKIGGTRRDGTTWCLRDNLVEKIVRPSAALLLAQQAGEMERLREEVARLETELAETGALSLEHAANVAELMQEKWALRAQLRAAETALQVYADPVSWDHDDLTYHDGHVRPTHIWNRSERPREIALRALARPAAPAEEGKS